MTAAVPLRAAITGTGYSMPPKVRKNDDPIFDYIKANDPTHGQLFFGYKDRQVLATGESINPYMVQAAQAALADASVAPADVDLLMGFTSISEYMTPNALTYVHKQLGLPATTWILPIQADYSNYSASLLLADSMISTGRAQNILIVCGSNWTQNMSYLTPPCVSIGDGAAATVVSATRDASKFRVVDFEVDVDSSGYGGMFTATDPETAPKMQGPPGDPANHAFTSPYFHLTAQGVIEFQQFGTQAPPKVISTLLQRNAVDASNVAVVCYQASMLLIDAWQKAIQPRQMLHTLEQFGNIVIASIAVNTAYWIKQIETDHVVLISVGAEPHAAGLLLRRNG